MTLDYNLNTPDERKRYLHNLNLSALNPHQLELCANYLLHTVDKSYLIQPHKTVRPNKKNNELNNGQAEISLKRQQLLYLPHQTPSHGITLP